jgi:ubiquinone/menaquinone biosynthesis C-methylase UbiE
MTLSTALQTWQDQVIAVRQEREEAEDQLWQRLAHWYNNWVQHNDYVDLVLPKLSRLVDSGARVLEVGPGSGAFTLPIARTVKEVVALEPALTMRDVLTHNLSKAGIRNVQLVPRHVEQGLDEMDGSFDLALASHSLYNVAAIDTVVHGLTRLARHVVILMGTGEQREWYQALHRRFKGRDRVPPPHLGHFYPILVEMGIYADVEILWTSYNYVYDSEEALLEWWTRHFHLDDTHRGELRAALLPIAERRGHQIGLFDRRRAALIWIDRKRSVFGAHS